MLGQARLLVDRLHRHEAHVALPGGGGDGLGVVAVVLGGLALAEGFDELGGHQAWPQPMVEAATGPVVGAAAGLHGDECAGRQLCQPGGKSLATQVLALDDAAGGVQCAGGKDRFGQVDADGYIAHGRLPSPDVPMVTTIMALEAER